MKAMSLTSLTAFAASRDGLDEGYNFCTNSLSFLSDRVTSEDQLVDFAFDVLGNIFN